MEQAESKEAAEKIQELKTRRNKYKAKLAQLDSEVTDLESKIRGSEAEIEKLRIVETQQKSEISHRSGLISSNKEGIENLRAQSKKKKARIEELKAKEIELQTRIESLNTDLESINPQEIEKPFAKKLADIEKKMNQAENERAQTELRLKYNDLKKEQSNALPVKKKQMEKNIAATQFEKDRIPVEIQRIEIEIHEIKGKKKHLKGKEFKDPEEITPGLNNTQSILDESINTTTALKENVKNIKKKIQKTQGKSKIAQKEMNSLKAENQRSSSCCLLF